MDFKARAAAIAAQAKADGVDQTKVSAGGGDLTPLAEGPCRLRLVSYIELGKHKGEYQGKARMNNKVLLEFEVSGPKHPPRVGEDGTKYPNIIQIKENLSQSDKARFFKLFSLLNYAGKATHTVELVGDAYKGRVVHRKYKGRDGTERVAVDLWNKEAGAWTIEPPRYEVVDPESGPTGEYAALKVDPPISPLRAFVWNYATLEDWSSVFIEGQWEERKNDKGEVTLPAKSKNWIQATIMSAENFTGSPIHELLVSKGVSLDIPDAESGRVDEEDEDTTSNPLPAVSAGKVVPEGAAADDALNGII